MMNLNLTNRQKRLAVGAGLMGASTFALADGQVIDSASIVTMISGAVTTISAIGVAILSLCVTIKLFKWVQRVL